MKHHQYNPDFQFVKEPVEFNKHTERRLLQYCLGATLYMPGTKEMADAILSKKLRGLTSMVMCFEDAIAEEDLPRAEKNVQHFLDIISKAMDVKTLSENDTPLFFIRVRSAEQFKSFTDKLSVDQIKVIAGFVFPKFGTNNGHQFLSHLATLNSEYKEIFYGMPILENQGLAYKETRMEELVGIKYLIRPFKDYILNVRVGATDFSSKFGVRRGIDYSIYDILTIRDCLSDVLNFLSRVDEDYVLSAPVWEYFHVDKSMKFSEPVKGDIINSILTRNAIVNEAIDGLLREVILDKANGFVGKTIIHPSHLKYVNAMQAVTNEEYEDAMQILSTSGGVIKSARANKMNEINPHRSWAEKIYYKAQAYGVIENEASYTKLFSV